MKPSLTRRAGSTLLAAAALCAVAAPTFADKKRDTQTPKVAEAMPITQVVLFSSGVGYFAREGQASGANSVELSFRAEQINDVLKSLVLFDASGDVKPITYTIPDALQSTRGLEVGGAITLGALLRSFQGAQVLAETKKEKIAGRIISVSIKNIELPNNRQTVIEVLNLLTEKGLRAVALDNVVRVQLLDEKLDGRLRENLSLAAQNFDNTRRTVTLNFGDARGTGGTPGLRAVRAGYLLETPVWKTTYRLVLGDAKTNEKPYLQGWAIAENTTDDDWKNVNLSLVAGRPISFIQDLYAPLYVPRPVVAPQVIGSPTPQLYGAALESAKADSADDMEVDEPASPAASAGYGGGGGAPGAPGLAGPPGLPSPVENRALVSRRREASVSAEQMAQSISSQATTQARGELFEYAIAQPVSIPHGQAALVPIVSETLNGEKISIFDARSSADYALSGFRLKNSTGLHLQGGPITVFDGGIYAGDAQISDLAPDEERLISYAVDPDLVIGREGQNNFQAIVAANVRAGVLQLQKRYRNEIVYTFRNKSKTEKTVWVQQPRNDSFDLASPEKADETTPNEYRFTVKVPAGQTVKFPVAVERVAGEAVALINLNLDLLINYTRNTQLSDAVRAALEQLVEKRRAIVATQERIARLEKEIQEFQQEQARIRENLESVKDGTELHARYLQKLAAQETQIENLQKQLADARDNLAEQQKALRAFVDALTV